jgi:class 3 adenylate cyclase
MEFTLIGVPVNNSAYLSKVRPARVLMSETTRARVPSGLRVSDFEPMQLKGANQPQAIYELSITVTTEEYD